jgi:Mitochondrial genome maintenance MGM101
MLTEQIPTPPEPPPADAKQLRTGSVGKLLDSAYQGASALKLNASESKKLREDFADTEIEIRPHDGIIYIGHMALRERLWEVFGPGAVAEICRERFMRNDANEIAVDLVLMIRGHFVAEAVGTAKYFANNPKMTFGDVVESAWSEALRRCCKKFGVGTQVWRPAFIREWQATNAVNFQGKWMRKGDPKTTLPVPGKTREYTLKEPSKFQQMKEAVQAAGPPKEDDEPIPF